MFVLRVFCIAHKPAELLLVLGQNSFVCVPNPALPLMFRPDPLIVISLEH